MARIPLPSQTALQSLDEALSLQQRGCLSAAAMRCASVLRRDSRNADALRLLGVIHAQQGKLDSAAQLLRRALVYNSRAAEGHNNLGLVLHALKRSEEAIACYRKAIAIRPRYVLAFNNLGIALAALNRTEEAITCYEEALAADPGYAETLSNLGTALHATGRYHEATERFRAALALRPDIVEAEVNLGNTLDTLGRTSEAIACYRSALTREPENAMAHLGLAGALRTATQHDAAARHYKQAIAISPDLASAHAGLGTVLQEVGQIDAARLCFERAIVLEPGRPSHFLSLARTVKLTQDDPHLAAMLTLANDDASFSDADRMDLHFALGQALADVGQRQRSFEHLLVANALKRRSVSYHEAEVLGRLERIRTVFTPHLIRRQEGGGDRSPAPIFIVGMPRSGSTLVEQILASHPRVFGVGEIEAFAEAGREIGLFTPDLPFPETVPRWTEQQFRALASNYLRRLQSLVAEQASHKTVERITDKMLSNFRFVGLIRLALPNARIIHTCRDPIETCLSCFSIQFKAQPVTYDLGELGRYYRAYARLMAHWHSMLPPGIILDVQYERLVANFESEARRIITHCRLEWDDTCLRFHETLRPVLTASAAQVRQPIYHDSVRRWRPETEILRPLIEGLELGRDDALTSQGTGPSRS